MERVMVDRKHRGGQRSRLAMSVSTLVACLALGATGCRPSTDRARRPQVRVAAASDLSGALPEAILRFTASHEIDVTATYGASGLLYDQLLGRGPFDLFLSADAGYPRELSVRRMTLDGTEFTYAIGRLVLWVPSDSAIDVEHGGVRLLADPGVKRVAVERADLSPYGRAAIAAMRASGAYETIRRKLTFSDNAAQVLEIVASGRADAGFVPLSLALAPEAGRHGRWFLIPQQDYPRLDQNGTILEWAADARAARELRAFLISSEGRGIFRRRGYELPP
jgi:molybdate transport system substrate-binding protein